MRKSLFLVPLTLFVGCNCSTTSAGGGDASATPDAQDVRNAGPSDVRDAGPSDVRDAGPSDVRDAGPSDVRDAGPSDGSDAGGEPCGTTSCQSGLACRFDVCVPQPPKCTADSQCQNDSYCVGGECIPYEVGPRGPSNPECKRLMVMGLFAPHTQCQWTEPPAGDPYPNHKNVLMTPLVVDFNFDDDPKTLEPSIVFVTYNCNDGAAGEENGCGGVVRVIDGKSCQQQYSMTLNLQPSGQTDVIASVTPAIGDLDDDGRPEIVTLRRGGGVVGWKFNATAKQFDLAWTSFAKTNVGDHWDSLALHDLDDDGIPEIIENGPAPVAYDAHGQLIDRSAVGTEYSDLIHPVLADVDGDGAVEMVDGREILRFDKATRRWVVASSSGSPLGQVALADFGTYGSDPSQDNRAALDGKPEIAVVTNGRARVQTLAGRVVFGPLAIPKGGTGGAPTVADFDGDGRAEFGVAGGDAYSVFDPDCTGNSANPTCPSGMSGGVLWSRQSQDHSSNVTGSSVFDFEGDGKAEVVYADECFSRVYDGRSGEVLFSQYHTSCTWYDNPIVADVDGDLRSEVVIPSNANCGVSCPALDPIHNGVRCDTGADCPGTTQCVREQATDTYGRCRCSTTADCAADNLACADPASGASAKGRVCRALHPTGKRQTGVLVLSDVLDRWVGSRPIWNQHAYAVTNVEDGGKIPRTSQWKQNWKEPKLNNFRMNVQGTLDPEQVPDLTSGGLPLGPDSPPACDEAGTYTLRARVCNRGTGPVAPGIPATFYEATKRAGSAICTTQTTNTLAAGACEAVSCAWRQAPISPTDVVVSVDDDGAGNGVRSECDEDNNIARLHDVYCQREPN